MCSNDFSFPFRARTFVTLDDFFVLYHDDDVVMSFLWSVGSVLGVRKFFCVRIFFLYTVV